MEKHQFSASASVGIWSVLDYSKNKRERSRQYEKAYFAPAFDRTTSFVKTDDSIQVKMQNTFLDICEICARWARKELKMVQDSMKAPGALTIMYMTIKDRTEQMKNGMFRAYFKDVFIDRKPNAFVEWQNLIRKRLDTTKHWATTPEECYRLMTGKPIEKGYVMAPMVVGSLNN
jgi:hypothetical protein